MTLDNEILKQKKKKRQCIRFSIYFKFFYYEGASLLQLEKSTISIYIRQIICILSFSFIKTDSFPNFPPPPRISVMKPYLRFLLTYEYVSCKKSL